MNIFLNVSLAFTIKLQQNHNTWLSGCNIHYQILPWRMYTWPAQRKKLWLLKEKALTAQWIKLLLTLMHIPQPMHSFSDINANLSVGVTSIHSFPENGWKHKICWYILECFLPKYLLQKTCFIFLLTRNILRGHLSICFPFFPCFAVWP